MSALEVLFIGCIGGCFYAYAGYPLLLLVLARWRSRPVRGAEDTPTVSILIAAHDEAATIAGKLANCLALEYPPGRLEVIVASDGSTDATDSLVDGCGDPRVRLLRLPRRGKIAALNDAAACAEGEILVFTDANVSLERTALLRLVRPFGDPSVGGVCGEKRLGAAAGDATADGEGAYARYDRWVKMLESRVGSVYGADGALYAVRRSLFVRIADLAQADDLAISGRIVLQRRRLVYEPSAICREAPPSDGLAELRRKVRVANHTIRATLGLLRAARPGFYTVELVSHKLARYAVPLLLITAWIANERLARTEPFYAVTFALQSAFYALVALGWALRARRAGRLRLFSVPYYFGLVNVAALLALFSWLSGRRHIAWKPRAGSSAAALGALMMLAIGAAPARAQLPPWQAPREPDVEIRFTPVIGWVPAFVRAERRAIVLQDRVVRGDFEVEHDGGAAAGATLEVRSFGRLRLTTAALFVRGGAALETALQNHEVRERPASDFLIVKAGIAVRLHEEVTALQVRSLNAALFGAPAYVLAIPGRDAATGGRQGPYGSWGLNAGIDIEAPIGRGRVGVQISAEDFVVMWNREELERRMAAELAGAGSIGDVTVDPTATHIWVLRAGLTFRLR